MTYLVSNIFRYSLLNYITKYLVILIKMYCSITGPKPTKKQLILGYLAEKPSQLYFAYSCILLKITLNN